MSAVTPVTQQSPPVSWVSRQSSVSRDLKFCAPSKGRKSPLTVPVVKFYRGALPLIEVGGTINIAKLPATKTKVGLILADVGQSLFLSRLREVPDFEVGLLRAEFMLGNVAVHPLALEAYDNGNLDKLVQDKLDELDSRLTTVMKAQLDSGLISLNINLREYVGALTGLADGNGFSG